MNQRWIYWYPCIHINISIITPWKCNISGSLGVEYFQLSLDMSAELCVLPPALASVVLCKVLVEHVRDQFRLLTLVVPCWMEFLWLPMILKLLEYVTPLVFCHKRSYHGCSSRPGAQGSSIAAFNPLAAQRYVFCRQGFSSSFRQQVMGAT